MKFGKLLSAAVLAAFSGLAALPVLPVKAADAWPSKPIKLVVPFPPGGGTDLVARAIGQKLATRLGQPVVVDNKPGASTIIGTDAVAKADADGYTLLISGSTSYSVNAALRAKLPYDPLKDLAPVAMVARAPLVLVVPANSPFHNLADLSAAARAKPGSLNYSTFGSGSAPHLAGALFGLAAGVKLQDVPYKGSSQALTALISGEIQFGIDTVATAAPQIRSGRLRALAIVGSVRSSVLPDVPTVIEQKLPEAVFDAWYAVAAPARTPALVLQRLTKEIAAVMADPEMQTQLRIQAMEPLAGGPEMLRNQMETEIARYRALAHRVGIVAE